MKKKNPKLTEAKAKVNVEAVVIKIFWRRVKQFFRVRGTWQWACDQMEKGNIVRPKSASGSVHYKLDDLTNRRIVWSFSKEKGDFSDHWDSANIFINDFESTDWVEWKPKNSL